MSILDALTGKRVLVLDGAMGTYLPEKVVGKKLWSAHALVNDPEEISKVHEGYFEAGANIVTTATYQASVKGFLEAGVVSKDNQEEEAARLFTRAVDLAKLETLGESDRFVAASIGPYGAYLAGGQEYTGDYGSIRDTQLCEFHRVRLETLQKSDADILAVETIPSLQELKVLIGMLNKNPAKPYWVALSVNDVKYMADGTPLSEAIKIIETGGNVVAVGVNCTSVETAGQTLEELAKHTRLPLIVYPNSGEIYNGETKQWESSASTKTLASEASGWHDLGARIVGGCCRTTPDDIKALREKVDQL
ncbi:homocysteine S-methyltransferase 1 [Trichomonascus vanleenenianus]|uniref:homocysteine S-methyltransferase n=1 Tax=Trichomonascus vanleenenianus TaxID=2268995 RepID=UPI003EC9F7B4